MARAPRAGAEGDGRKPATRVKAGALAAALKDVRDVAGGGKESIPILSDVLIEARDGAITITATNLDIWVVRELVSDDRDGPASKDWLESIRPFRVALPARALADVVGAYDGDAMVTLTGPQDGESRAVVAAGRSRVRLACLPVEDFPGVPPLELAHAFEIHASVLADSLAAVRHAVSTEETRYYLNGIYFHALEDLTLRMAATDGHRLARLIQEAPEGAAAWPAMIVPRRVTDLVRKLAEAAAKTGEGADGGGTSSLIVVEADDAGTRTRWTMPAAEGGEVTIVAKSIDGTFPDYTRVIPAAVEIRARVNRAQLGEALRRVMLLAPDKSNAVKAEFEDGKLRLSVTNEGLGDAAEELPCAQSGGDITIGFNGRYWREVLSALATDEVAIGMTDAVGPALILAGEDDDAGSARLLQVLMPMRV